MNLKDAPYLTVTKAMVARQAVTAVATVVETASPENTNPEEVSTPELILQANAPAPLPTKDGIDVESVFMIYVGFCGDVWRTAKACGLTAQQVLTLADEGGWLERIRELIDLKKIGKDEDVARALNRATNFVQANRLRLYIERVVRKISLDSDDEILGRFLQTKTTKEGETVVTGVSFRFLADIASALEKIHWMTYQAIADSNPERIARKAAEKPEGALSAEDVHAKISKTLASMRIAAPAAPAAPAA